jgi:hypothetical protein
VNRTNYCQTGNRSFRALPISSHDKLFLTLEAMVTGNCCVIKSIDTKAGLFSKVSRLARESSQPPIQWLQQGAISPRVKRLVRETDH